MEAMRACSGELCGSEKTGTASKMGKLGIRRLHSLPMERSRFPFVQMNRRESLSAALAVALRDYDTAVDAEAELLVKEDIPEVFSYEYSKQVANLQALERVKGNLNSALLDLDEPDTEDGFSVDDWTKLNAAREQYTHEKAALDREEVTKRERRKQERAVKRAARKAKAEALPSTEAALSSDSETPKITPRRAESVPLASSGARGLARSRSRTVSSWGRPAVAETAHLTKTGGRPSKAYSRGDPSLAASGFKSHELLSQAEEVELSKRVQDFLLCERTLTDMEVELGYKPDFASWADRLGEKENSLRDRLELGLAARTRMLSCNQRLVVSIARKYQNKGMEMSDLIQEGMVGLLRGVEKFDHSKGFRFSTYATWWIRQAISRSITELSRLIRLPAHLNEIMGKMLRAEKEFMLANGRAPKEDEVAKMLGLPVERLRMVKQASGSPKSLHENLKKNANKGDASETTLEEVIEDKSFDDMDAHVVKNSMHRDVNAVLNTLNPREHGIIRMRYGLDDGQPKTLEEIGVAFHVTRERIRQIENKALANLKNPSRHSTLNTYVDGEAQSLLASIGFRPGTNRDSSQ